MAKIAASDCRPGFYRVKCGDIIEIVRPSRVNRRWPPRSMAGAVPYRRKAMPQGGQALYGFLPPSYPLRPAKRPRWWRKANKLFYPTFEAGSALVPPMTEFRGEAVAA